MRTPPTFGRRVRRHNRHALLGATFSLLGAFFLWAVFYGIGVGITLGLLTIVQGQRVIEGETLLRLPWWLPGTFGVFFIGSLVWQALEARHLAGRPTPERPIIGWHLARDFLLLPAKLTFAVAGNLGSILWLGSREIDEALGVLDRMESTGKVPFSTPGAWFSSLGRMRQCFQSLQLLGWVDFHPAEPEPFYLIRSDEADEVTAILREAGLREVPLTET